MNPLIATTSLETIQNVAKAMDALMVMLADTEDDLYWLLSPIQAAIDEALRTDNPM